MSLIGYSITVGELQSIDLEDSRDQVGNQRANRQKELTSWITKQKRIIEV